MGRAAALVLSVILCACGDSEEGVDGTSGSVGGAAASGSLTGGQPPAGGSLAGFGSGGSSVAPAPTAGTPAAGGGGGSAAVGGSAGGGVDAGGAPDAGAAPGIDAGPSGVDSGVDAGPPDLRELASGFDELFMHDECTGDYPPQPDTCLHDQQLEESFSFGGDSGVVYDVTLRVRGLFEPTTISGGQTPMPEHPYFKVGGTVSALDWSHWHIEVSDPPQTYWLNHYPSTSHTIYQEDFEATIQVAGGADVVVRVIDGNDREIDNAEPGLSDRQQLIDGVTQEVLDGQMLRLDVLEVEPH